MHHIEGMPEYRFMFVGKDLLDEAKKFDREVTHRTGTGLPSSEMRLRSYAVSYLLKRIMRTEGKHVYSTFVDSFWEPIGLKQDIVSQMKGEKKRFYVSCGHDFDRKIPIVNDADALAYFHFDFMRGDKSPPHELAGALDELFPANHINVYSNHFFEGYVSATRRKAGLGIDTFLNRAYRPRASTVL